MTSFAFERPIAERTKLRSVQAVMDAFPDVRLVIDAKEQRIRRPKSKKDDQGNMQDHQKPYYSGKKKTHTLKNQIAVRPDGFIDAVSQRRRSRSAVGWVGLVHANPKPCPTSGLLPAPNPCAVYSTAQSPAHS